jgi:hypothetical protein
MRRQNGTWTVIVPMCAVLVAALASCSGEVPADEASQQNSETAAPEAGAEASASAAGCELLTTEEIQAAIGAAPDRSEEGQGSRACNWFTADGRSLVGVVVGAAQRTYEEYMQNIREQDESAPEDLEMSRVEGVGDYAVWHGPGYLNAAQDGELLVVWVFADPSGGKSKQAAAVELARIALPRL